MLQNLMELITWKKLGTRDYVQLKNSGMFAQLDLVIAKTVKPYNSVYWINRLSNFIVQRFFESFFDS